MDWLPFVGVVRLLLHHFEDASAGVGAVLRVAVDGDGLLQGSHVLLTVHVHPRPGLLRDLADGAALAPDDGAHHFAGHQQPNDDDGKTTTEKKKTTITLALISCSRVSSRLAPPPSHPILNWFLEPAIHPSVHRWESVFY